MKATQLEYGKFQTSIFRLAQELGERGDEAVTRLNWDNAYRARVAGYMLAGAPGKVIVTVDSHKATKLAEIHRLEATKGLTPNAVCDKLEQLLRSKQEMHDANVARAKLKKDRPLCKDYRASYARCDYLDWRGEDDSFRGDLDSLAEILGTSSDHLERISERFEREIKLEFDPHAEINQTLKHVPDNIRNLGQFLLWLEAGAQAETPNP